MLDKNDVLSTMQMIDRQHLDIRTITMGISLLSCADRDAKAACEKIYDKITRYAEGLVKTGEDIEREFGIPHRQQAHLRHTHGHRGRGLQKRGLRPRWR